MQKPEEQAAEISRILAILHKWGIHTLGQLAALPQDELGARLGPLAAHLWTQANGTSTRLLHLVRPPEIFAEEIEFEHEIETAEPLLFVLRRQLEQLSRRLAALYLVTEELSFHLTFSNKTRYQHRFQIPEPTNSVELLFRILQTHLENFRSEYPIIAAGLEAEPARPTQQQFQFFETPLRDPVRLHQTLNRLTGLFGRERVGRPVLEDSHRPDAFHLEPFTWDLGEMPNEPPESAAIGPTLRRIRLKGASTGVPGAGICNRQGPYRSSGDWWDEKGWEQTEWDIQLENGALCRCREQPDEFKLEGIYD